MKLLGNTFDYNALIVKDMKFALDWPPNYYYDEAKVDACAHKFLLLLGLPSLPF